MGKLGLKVVGWRQRDSLWRISSLCSNVIAFGVVGFVGSKPSEGMGAVLERGGGVMLSLARELLT